MKKHLLFITFVTFFLSVISNSFAQEQLSAPLTQKLTDNIYTVNTGIGARTGFVVGDNGVLIIDATSNEKGIQIMQNEIAKVTSLPITTVILTHSDPDHVGGLKALPRGVEIISQEQAKLEMEKASEPILPGKTFTDKMDFEFAPEKMHLIYLAHAHTNGDAVIIFPKEKLAFTGDIINTTENPVMHPDKGSNTDGLIKALNALLKLDVERYVTGHSGIVGKDEIREMIKHVEDVKAKVAPLVKEGKTLEEVKEALGVAGESESRFQILPEIIYNELVQKK